MNKIQRLLRSTRAATAVEYGLILALVFLAALVAISAVGSGTITMWNRVSSNATRVL